MPFMSSIIQDMRTMTMRIFNSPIFPKSGSDVMFSVREIMHNMRNAHGDNRFDIYDWIPLFAVLFATALILNGIFPNSLALSGQGLTFGRKNRAQDTEEGGEEENVLDSAMAQLENGVLLMSAIRAGGDCSARLACRLGLFVYSVCRGGVCLVSRCFIYYFRLLGILRTPPGQLRTNKTEMKISSYIYTPGYWYW